MTKRAALVAVALAIASCTSAPRSLDSPGAAWNSTHAALDSLGAAGRLAEALAVVDSALGRGATTAWLVADLGASRAAWRDRVAAPDSVRESLREADAAMLRLEPLMASDSVTVARDLVMRAAASRTRWLGASDPATLRAALTAARMAFRLGRGAETESLLAGARAALPAAWGTDHPLHAEIDELTGRVLKNFHGLARESEARAAYDRALAVRARAFGDRSLEVAELHQQIGNLDRAARRPAEARAHFERALAIRRERRGPRHEDVAATLSAMAFLAAAEGDWRGTARRMREALAADPDSAHMTALTRSTRFGLIGQALRRMDRARDAVPWLSAAATAAETVWSRLPQDGSSSIHAGLSVHRELAMALAAEGRDDEAFVHLERGQSRLSVAPGDVDPWTNLRERVQARLPDDAAVVCWPRTNLSPPGGDHPMWACVLRARGPARWVRLERLADARPAGEGSREVLLLEVLRGARWPLRLTDARAVDSLAVRLARERVAPLEPLLAGVKRLIVVGPDLMGVAPLCMLPDSHGVSLGERFELVYAPSALAWVTLAERASGAPAREVRHALLVGAPSPAPGDSGRWAPLGGAAGEMQALASVFPEAVVLAGAEASAERLRRIATSRAFADVEVIHFATHLDVDAARAMRSSFVLAPDAASHGASSRVTAGEIASSWRVAASLVSLAACRSAAGLTSASEGPLGMHQAFLAAGARNVLVSHWWVEDAATARLMQEFHRRLAEPGGANHPARALGQAQRAVREWRAADGSRPFAHPVYWAGFAVVGAG